MTLNQLKQKVMTYLFNKFERKEDLDFPGSYCFKSAFHNVNLFSLSKKATEIIDRGTHLEVIVADWYLEPKEDETINRKAKECERLQESYNLFKKIENETKERES